MRVVQVAGSNRHAHGDGEGGLVGDRQQKGKDSGGQGSTLQSRNCQRRADTRSQGAWKLGDGTTARRAPSHRGVDSGVEEEQTVTLAYTQGATAGGI